MKYAPYFPQEHPHTCSLAVLRMVLAAQGIVITESDLIQKVAPIYGEAFTHLWNPTLAHLARDYRLPTTLYAKNIRSLTSDPQYQEELSKAEKAGCLLVDTVFTVDRLIKLLTTNHLVQVSVRLDRMYKGAPSDNHSILVYRHSQGIAFFHDPSRGPDQQSPLHHLVRVAKDSGVIIAYQIKTPTPSR